MSSETGWRLGPAARSRGVRLAVFDCLDSTNDEAKRQIDAGERGSLWIVAGRQTGGRGRLGRSWISPPGNLYASLIVSGDFAPAVAPQLGFVASLAALRALEETTQRVGPFKLKWPNDLLLERAKLGGILLEGVAAPALAGNGSSDFVAVVGIGVNLESAPEGLPYPAASLRRLGPEAPSAQDFFPRLADGFVVALDTWANGAGFAAIRARWLEAAAGLGETIRLRLARGEEIEARFGGIDGAGRLIAVTTAGERVIDAGDVFLAHEEAGVSVSAVRSQ